MNISMFMKLHIGIKYGKVKMNNDYKYFDYMQKKEWISLTISDIQSISKPNFYMINPIYSDYVEITDKGKDAYFKARNTWIKWALGTIISICIAITTTLLRL